jgi:hypothetical protein
MTKQELNAQYEQERKKLLALKADTTKQGQLAYLAQYDHLMKILNQLAAMEWQDMKKRGC